MYLANYRYYWSLDESIDLAGMILSASSMSISHMNDRIENGKLDTNNKILLFDPQLYMIKLDKDKCKKSLANLATYPWFPTPIVPYDSDSENKNEFIKGIRGSISNNWIDTYPQDSSELRQLIKESIAYQQSIDCSSYIISTPIINDENDIEKTLKFIDIGIDCCKNLRLGDSEIFATLAINESCLAKDGTDRNNFIDILVDQFSSRREINGVYFILERNGDKEVKNQNVALGILSLAYLLGRKSNLKFLTNYCGNFGLITLGAGASYFGSDGSNKTRRLVFEDYVDRSGGIRYPYFFSLSCLSFFRTQRDLEKIRDRRWLRYIENDVTKFSEDFFQGLKDNVDIETRIPDWAEQPNRVTQSRNHYSELLTREANKLNELSFEGKVESISQLLQDADMKLSFMQEDLKDDDPLTGGGSYVRVWRKAFEKFISYYLR